MQLSGNTFHLSTILFEKNLLPYIQSTSSFEQLFAMTSSSSIVKCTTEVVGEERMRPGHQLDIVLCVPSNVLTLMGGRRDMCPYQNHKHVTFILLIIRNACHCCTIGINLQLLCISVAGYHDKRC